MDDLLNPRSLSLLRPLLLPVLSQLSVIAATVQILRPYCRDAARRLVILL